MLHGESSNKPIFEVIKDLLAIDFNTDKLQNCPLLERLLEKLIVDESSKFKKYEIQVQEAKEVFLQKKMEYFKYLILYNAVLQSTDKCNNKLTKSCDCGVQHKCCSVKNATNMIFMAEDILCQDTCFFGISNSFMENHFSFDKQYIFDLIYPEVKKEIYNLSRTVLSYYGQNSTDKLVFSKMSQLPYLLEKDKKHLETKHVQIQKEKKQYDELVHNCFDNFVNSIMMLKGLLELQNKEVCYYSCVTKFHIVKCDALVLKAKILELQILLDTYTKETVPCLKIIRQQLFEQNGKVEKDIEEKTLLLNAYKVAGKTFKLLVEEYTSVRQAIKNEKWALEELKKSQVI